MQHKLHPKQTWAIGSLATEMLYGGGAGGGKSHLMRVAAILWCSLIPGLQVYIFRRTFPDLWKNHMIGPNGFPAMLAPWLLERKVKINEGKNTITFWNGSMISLCHCQHEKDVYGYQGAEIHVLMMDELTQFTSVIYKYLRGRVRAVGLKIPEGIVGRFPRVLCSSNPGGIGHNWVKQMFVSIQPEGRISRMPKDDGGMDRQYIKALMTDNPSIMEDDPDYDSRLAGLGSPELVKAMRLGDWDIVAGGMFDDVWSKEIHVLPAIPYQLIPQEWRMYRTFDWGSSKPFSVGWWAESDGTRLELPGRNPISWPKGTYLRFNEWYGWNGEANTGCKMITTEIARGIMEREERMQLTGRINPGPADSSIYDPGAMGSSIGKDMEDVGVYFEPANKAAGTRIRGWEMMRTRFEAGKKFPMEDPGMFVTDNCTQFIRTVPTLVRDPKNTEDVDTDTEDHVGDETRYLLLSEQSRIEIGSLVGH